MDAQAPCHPFHQSDTCTSSYVDNVEYLETVTFENDSPGFLSSLNSWVWSTSDSYAGSSGGFWLETACYFQQWADANAIVEKYYSGQYPGANVDHSDTSIATALQLVAYRNGPSTTANLLLANGASRTRPDPTGKTAAEIARAEGHTALADWIDAWTPPTSAVSHRVYVYSRTCFVVVELLLFLVVVCKVCVYVCVVFCFGEYVYVCVSSFQRARVVYVLCVARMCWVVWRAFMYMCALCHACLSS